MKVSIFQSNWFINLGSIAIIQT